MYDINWALKKYLVLVSLDIADMEIIAESDLPNWESLRHMQLKWNWNAINITF